MAKKVVCCGKSPITLSYFQGNKEVLKTEKIGFISARKTSYFFWEESLKLRFSRGKNLNFKYICSPMLALFVDLNRSEKL